MVVIVVSRIFFEGGDFNEPNSEVVGKKFGKEVNPGGGGDLENGGGGGGEEGG